MSKQSGLGDALYVAGVDLSGDIGALGKISGSQAVQDVTGIDKSAMERIGLVRDGGIDYTAFFNPTRAHPKLSTLPTTDQVMTYCRGTTLGSPAACMVAKQLNYDGNRTNSGEFTFAVAAVANGYGLEWGALLTAGLRTDTGATNGASIDTAASLAFGAQAYLHVTAFTGTDATVKIQDSADNVSFADVAGLAFTQITAGPTSERIATGGSATIRRYLRAVTVTTGGFSSITFAVAISKNPVSVVF